MNIYYAAFIYLMPVVVLIGFWRTDVSNLKFMMSHSDKLRDEVRALKKKLKSITKIIGED